ncbi:hypothetical protein BGX24_010733 [Mortierella sp. AD032]|nr:hypothetical protein BGX24_010733 [Mortierella sp. AD032]
MYDVAVPVTIKGIEFTALADSTLFESRISSRVVEGLGLCVTPPMVLYCNPKTFYHSIGRTADDIPVYFCHLEEPKFVRFEVDEDMGYYDLKLGRQLFGDDDLTQHYKWARANGYM